MLEIAEALIAFALVAGAWLEDQRFQRQVRPDYGTIRRLEDELYPDPVALRFGRATADAVLKEAYRPQPYKIVEKDGYRYHYYEDGRMVYVSKAVPAHRQVEMLALEYERMMRQPRWSFSLPPDAG